MGCRKGRAGCNTIFRQKFENFFIAALYAAAPVQIALQNERVPQGKLVLQGVGTFLAAFGREARWHYAFDRTVQGS